MILNDVIAAVDRYREQVRAQAQWARDIQHLREVARMLFEDKPDKTKAVEAVNDIAAKRLARMDADARALLDSATSNADRVDITDRGDLLSWLMLVNQPGQFPYTQGIGAAGEQKDRDLTAAARSRVLCASPQGGRVDTDPAPHLAAALAEGWAWLAGSAPNDQRAADAELPERAAQLAIEFDEHRDARHRALARAARRLWAVSLRAHFGIGGDGLKLVLIPSGPAEASRHTMEIGDRETDQAEDALLAALRMRVRPSVRD